MGDLRARDVTQSGGPINGEYCSVDQWEPLKPMTSRAREVTGPAAESTFWRALALILDVLGILVNINIMIFLYILLINGQTSASPPLYPFFIIKIYIFI